MELKDAVAKRVLELCKEYNIKPSKRKRLSYNKLRLNTATDSNIGRNL